MFWSIAFAGLEAGACWRGGGGCARDGSQIRHRAPQLLVRRARLRIGVWQTSFPIVMVVLIDTPIILATAASKLVTIFILPILESLFAALHGRGDHPADFWLVDRAGVRELTVATFLDVQMAN